MGSNKPRRNTLSELNVDELPKLSTTRKKQSSFCQRRVSTDASSSKVKSWLQGCSTRRKGSDNSSQSSLAALFANEMTLKPKPAADSSSEAFESANGVFLWNFPFTLLESNEQLTKQHTFSNSNPSSSSLHSMLGTPSQQGACSSTPNNPASKSPMCRRGSLAPLMGGLHHTSMLPVMGLGSNDFAVVPGYSQGGTMSLNSSYDEDRVAGSFRGRNRLHQIFSGKEKDTMEKMRDILDRFIESRGGVAAQLRIEHQDFLKEFTWQTLVGETEQVGEMSKKERDYQEAIWELLKSEVLYMEKLHVLSELFISALEEVQNEYILIDVNKNRLFGNLEQVYEAHKLFWIKFLQPCIYNARENGQLVNAEHICEGFAQISNLFRPHLSYIKEQESCTQYARNTYQSNEVFKVFVVWCENQKICERLKLTDLLVKPMQRLAQYPLLIQAILKNSSSEAEQNALHEAMTSVQQFLVEVNATLRLFSEQEKVISISERLEPFDMFDIQSEDLNKAVETYTKFDIAGLPLNCGGRGAGGRSSVDSNFSFSFSASFSSTGSFQSHSLFRHLLIEGPWRLKDGSRGKMDVYTYLFADILLLTKGVNKKMTKQDGANGVSNVKLRPIHPPMSVSQIVVKPVLAQQDTSSSSSGNKNSHTLNNNNNNSSGSPNSCSPPVTTSSTFTLVYLNECNVAMSAFLVNVGSPNNASTWINGINNAKSRLQSGIDTSWTSASLTSSETSLSQRKTSKAANQMKTFLNTTGMSAEEEEDPNSLPAFFGPSTSNFPMTPVMHHRSVTPQISKRTSTGTGTEKHSPSNQTDSPATLTSSKAFGSNSSPNLSECLSPTQHRSLEKLSTNSPDISMTTPNITPPPSPLNFMGHSPLALSPKLGDNRRDRGCVSPGYHVPFENNPITSTVKSKHKFSLPRRKVSDSAVPITYTYQYYQQPPSSQMKVPTATDKEKLSDPEVYTLPEANESLQQHNSADANFADKTTSCNQNEPQKRVRKKTGLFQKISNPLTLDFNCEPRTLTAKDQHFSNGTENQNPMNKNTRIKLESDSNEEVLDEFKHEIAIKVRCPSESNLS